MSPPPGTTLPLVLRAAARQNRTAIVTAGAPHTYGALLDASARVAAALCCGTQDLDEMRVAFLIPPGFDHVAVQWGIWRAGGIAAPLAVSHPPPEMEYVIRDADARLVVADEAAAATLRPLAESAGARFLTTREVLAAAPAALPAVTEDRRALMVYTSGTTGRPKGVVTTHANLRSQVTSLAEAWAWSEDDHTLLVLPLHHIHGIVNVVASTLWAGASCEMLPHFDAEATWEIIASARLTVFMAVPTIYKRLITAWEAAPRARQQALSDAVRRLRLMVSGSAALPVQTLERWREITGHTLLERYGMTEIGMALGNPLAGPRRPGSVGVPFPGVEVRVVDDRGAPVPPGTAGEIEVRGATVFLEYWRRPDATRDAFHDGWFRTGDTAVVEDGCYRILGRSSVDIIKTGGYKVSALEIEEVLRTHPAIAECAVVGIADDEWGERISVAVELRRGAGLDLDGLKGWARELLAPYKVPRALTCVEALPRNAMGKVMKPDVARLFGAPSVPRPSPF